MKPITQDELDELLGTDPLTLASRRPFQNWTDDDIDALPDLQWLVGDEDHPVLLEGSLWQTIGLLKSAKTFYCLEIAFCVAFGLKFHGLDVKQGKVVYILAEGGIKRNYKRVRALYQKYRDQMQAKGYDSLKAARASGNLIMIDQTISLADEDPNAPTAPKAFLAEMELENVRPVLVVLDTWARALWEAGGHDSDQKTVGPSIQACEHIRKVLGGCTLIMVAHVGAAKDAQGRAKGLTDPAGAIDGGTLCKRLGEGALAVYSFKAIHQRHATSDSHTLSALLRSPYDAESHGVGDSVVLMSGDGVVSAAMKQTRLAPATAKLLDVLKAMAAGASVDQWKHAAITAGVLTGTADARKHAFNRGRMALEKAGAVTVEPLTGMVDVAQGPDGEDIDYGTAAEDFEGCEEDAE